MNAILWLITTVIDLYVWIIILQVVLSWLIAFNVINTSNRFVYTLVDFLWRLTEPALKPIRQVLGRFLPNLGGIDISPIALLLVIILAQGIIGNLRAALHASGI